MIRIVFSQVDYFREYYKSHYSSIHILKELKVELKVLKDESVLTSNQYVTIPLVLKAKYPLIFMELINEVKKKSK